MSEEKKERLLIPAESRSIKAGGSRKKNPRNLFVVEAGKDNEVNCNIVTNSIDGLTETDAYDEYCGLLHEATGCSDRETAIRLIWGASSAITQNPKDTKNFADNLNKIGAQMYALEPRDEIEGMLVSQLIVLHDQSMEWLGKAMRTERIDFANTYLNASTKLINRHHETLKSLMRYRQGGDQKIIVENVIVNNGGRAIVGNVAGGGSTPQK